MRLSFNKSFAILSVSVVFIFAVVMPFLALASGAFPLPEGDPAQLLLKLATNWKALGVLGIASTATLLTSIAINAWVPETWKFKRLTSLFVAMLYSGLVAAIVPNGSELSSVVGVLVTGLLAKGGASEIYEALKGAGIIKKSS